MRILVLGISGMLGNAIFRFFSRVSDFECIGTVRNHSSIQYFPKPYHKNIHVGCDLENQDQLLALFEKVKPDLVINAIGLVKQLETAKDPLMAVPINTLLPHRLARLCALSNSRFVHISTDCVFSGLKGLYLESDTPDASDIYGLSKFLGEVDYPHAITLRTSIIGHELNGNRSLINWFLSQTEEVKGYKNAIFSGLPTVEIARIIMEYVIPLKELRGLFHVSAEPIDKFSLLSLVADVYGKKITITPESNFHIDRSLNSSRFRLATGYCPPSWPELIKKMHEFM